MPLPVNPVPRCPGRGAPPRHLPRRRRRTASRTPFTTSEIVPSNVTSSHWRRAAQTGVEGDAASVVVARGASDAVGIGGADVSPGAMRWVGLAVGVPAQAETNIANARGTNPILAIRVRASRVSSEAVGPICRRTVDGGQYGLTTASPSSKVVDSRLRTSSASMLDRRRGDMHGCHGSRRYPDAPILPTSSGGG